jgi:hypothetical protein
MGRKENKRGEEKRNILNKEKEEDNLNKRENKGERLLLFMRFPCMNLFRITPQKHLYHDLHLKGRGRMPHSSGPFSGYIN